MAVSADYTAYPSCVCELERNLEGYRTRYVTALKGRLRLKLKLVPYKWKRTNASFTGLQEPALPVHKA